MATKDLKKAQYGTATGKSRGMYDPNTGMNRPTTPMDQAKKGAIVKKKMAKGGSASSALKTFNDNKAMAYKKAGGAMLDYKKYLKKAQYGQTTSSLNGYDTYEGPVSKTALDRISSLYPESYGPRAITPEVTEADNMKRMGENFDRIPQASQSGPKNAKRRVKKIGDPKNFSMNFNKVGGSTKRK